MKVCDLRMMRVILSFDRLGLLITSLARCYIQFLLFSFSFDFIHFNIGSV